MNTDRPRTLVAVAGTGTDVGKTWVAAQLLGELRARGRRVAARKPVQSFDPHAAGLTDAGVLAGASGDQDTAVCPPHRWYPLAVAPPMAVDRLSPADAPLRLADLLGELDWGANAQCTDVGLVEAVGGVRSPVSHDADSADLVRALRADLVLLVADAGLGTINAVRTALPALADVGAPVVVVLNRFDEADPLHGDNLVWLRDRDGTAVVAATGEWRGRLTDLIESGPPLTAR